MLYHLAKLYDEFAGEDDAGSSLRGALKGWFHHGVLPEERWPSLDMDPVPDLDDEELVELARQWPLAPSTASTPSGWTTCSRPSPS